MNIAIDLTPLQGPHRLRGIGSTLINFVSNISKEDRAKHLFTFILYPELQTEFDDPISLLNLKDMKYTLLTLDSNTSYLDKSNADQQKGVSFVTNKIHRFSNLIKIPFKHLKDLSNFYFGDYRIKNLNYIDVFLQTDQSLPLPRNIDCKKVLIIYDLIPYILEKDYLNSYSTSRQNGHSRKGALRAIYYRWLYIKKLKLNVHNADRLIAISNHTAKDFHKIVGAPKDKIKITHLGISIKSFLTDNKKIKFEKYVNTSWGAIKKPFEFNSNIPFLLFIGGADSRRKIEDLVAAFNNLRAQGIKLNLVLVGDSMSGADNIATKVIKKALKESSYLDDVIFLGFVTDKEREWLYRNAAAFIFPSRYEGFGLPILESMGYGCPVICYPNEAVLEVAKDVPIYANDVEALIVSIEKVIELPSSERNELITAGLNQAGKFTWPKTAKEIIESLYF